MVPLNPRQLAFIALRDVHKGAYVNVALDRVLQKVDLPDGESSPKALSSGNIFDDRDRRLVTELVYGSVRRQRTLDILIDQLGKKKSHQQPKDLRTILHLGLYQLRYQERIPASAAVNTTVQLAKENGFSGLTGFVNGLLRQYIRIAEDKQGKEDKEKEEISPPLHASRLNGGNLRTALAPLSPSPTSHSLFPLKLPDNPAERLGILHSFPDWIIQVWVEQLGFAETEQLCQWMNKTPAIDIRVNKIRTSLEEVELALQSAGVLVKRIPHLSHALRLSDHIGSIQKLPGFHEGWWTVQDSSAQMVSHLLAPQKSQVIIDACAAPGGKTTHIAELIGDEGTIWACDRTATRLKKLQENIQRLKLKSIQICTGDSRNLPQFNNLADCVLLDAPCSGLGTLNRHADARWRQSTETVQELSVLQKELLAYTSYFVKQGGVLVYATCTLHPAENEDVIKSFLAENLNWQIEPPSLDSSLSAYSTSQGWIKVWPHRFDMDGFFMVRLRKTNN